MAVVKSKKAEVIDPNTPVLEVLNPDIQQATVDEKKERKEANKITKAEKNKQQQLKNEQDNKIKMEAIKRLSVVELVEKTMMESGKPARLPKVKIKAVLEEFNSELIRINRLKTISEDDINKVSMLRSSIDTLSNMIPADPYSGCSTYIEASTRVKYLYYHGYITESVQVEMLKSLVSIYDAELHRLYSEKVITSSIALVESQAKGDGNKEGLTLDEEFEQLQRGMEKHLDS